MINSNKRIKVLLCLNGDKDINKPLMDRSGALLRYALEAVNIEYTYDIRENYDIIHLLSVNQYKAYLNMPNKNKLNKNVPVVLSMFNDSYDIKEDLDNDEEDFLSVLTKAVKPLDVNLVTCPWTSQTLILKHLNVFRSVNLVNIGAKEYLKESYSPVELEAFKKYYGLEKDDKVIITIGQYNYSKGLAELEAISRIMPEYEFFFFGGQAGILSNSKHYGKNNDIPNLHYEDHIPNELYHSAIFSATAAFFPYRYHVETSFILELMKAGVPVVSGNNPFLGDLLIDKKTALIGNSVEEFYKLLKNIKKENCAKKAKAFADQFTPLTYGTRLKEIYTRLILSSDADRKI